MTFKFSFLCLFFILFSFSNNISIPLISVKNSLSQDDASFDPSINFQCRDGILSFTVDLDITGNLKSNYYFSFSPSDSEYKGRFKCALERGTETLHCFSQISDEKFFRERKSSSFISQIPYYLPESKQYLWDYESFIYSFRHAAEEERINCYPFEPFKNISFYNSSVFGALGGVDLNTDKKGGKCAYSFENKKLKFFYEFNLTMSLLKGELREILEQSKDVKVKFLQEIWLGENTEEDSASEGYFSTMLNYFRTKEEKEKTYITCKINEEINSSNFNNINLECSQEVNVKNPFKGKIKIRQTCDKVYINIKPKFKEKGIDHLIKVCLAPKNLADIETDSLNDYLTIDNEGKVILCPDKPIFKIKTKNEGITFDTYYSNSNKFTFVLKGILTNGYTYENNTLVELTQTNKEVNFPLILSNNLLFETDDKETQVSCILSTNSIFNTPIETTIRCLGTKQNISENSYYYYKNDFIDFTLNWDFKKNNIFDDIIISWPETFDNHKKNLYSYETQIFSIKQAFYGCDIEKDIFTFFLTIHDFGYEPRISFDLPLLYPTNPPAYCEIFNSKTLKCQMDLKHKIMKKGMNITLLPNTELDIFNKEGNKNRIIINNLKYINNQKDNSIIMEENCGQFIILGTLNDMGISKKGSFSILLGAILFVCAVVICIITYAICIIVRIAKRGRRVATSEKGNNSSTDTIGANKKNK